MVYAVVFGPRDTNSHIDEKELIRKQYSMQYSAEKDRPFRFVLWTVGGGVGEK